jgi:hypothetical protein
VKKKIFFLLFVVLPVSIIAIGTGFGLLKNISNDSWQPVATFSLLGYDPDTGEVGGAVQSRVFCVGNGVLWGEANVGVVATQAIVDVSYGPRHSLF